MTVHDTTYFISEPKQFKNAEVGNQWHNTFKFISNTLYKKRLTYSDQEIQNHLENKKPLTNDFKKD